MSKSKVQMPANLKSKCSMVIHTATLTAAVSGISPIPMSDAIPITAAQITMIVSLGKIFDVTLSQSAAKSLVCVGATQQAGRAIAASLIKAVPGVGTVVGGVICGSTAASLTEALGWMVADDFYRMSNGEEPVNIAETSWELKNAFNGFRWHK